MKSAGMGGSLRALVYLPDGYAGSGLRYPVVYLLHGSGGNESVWVRRGNIVQTADRLIGQGAMPPAIIVMPGCYGCWWIDSSRTKAESAVLKDLIPAVERKFRTIKGRAGRAVVGQSAGGYGAIRLALRYPDKFAAAAALSPAIYATAPPSSSAARSLSPFVDRKGRFNQAMWAANNYTSFIDRYLAQPVHLPIYLVSGDGDRLGIAFESALLFKRLFDVQPEIVELRVVDGEHSWAVWGNAVDKAMSYVFQFTRLPQPDLALAHQMVSFGPRRCDAGCMWVASSKMPMEANLCIGKPARSKFSVGRGEAANGDMANLPNADAPVDAAAIVTDLKCLARGRFPETKRGQGADLDQSNRTTNAQRGRGAGFETAQQRPNR